MKKQIHTASRKARDETPVPLQRGKLSPDPVLGTITQTLECSKIDNTGDRVRGTNQSQFLRGHRLVYEQDPFFWRF